MRLRLPPLNSLRLFEASARLLSFKNAAEELLLTPSAVATSSWVRPASSRIDLRRAGLGRDRTRRRLW